MFHQPKIFLIDIEKEAHETILKKWSSVNSGTLGTPYHVSSSSHWDPVIQPKSLKNFEESDIVIVDLASKEITMHAPHGKHAPEQETDLWAKCDKGWIDARTRTSLLIKENLDRIVKNGGILIAFSAPDSPMKFQWAYANRNNLVTENKISGGVWNLTTPFERLELIPESGSTIEITEDSLLATLLNRHLQDAKFTCTFRYLWSKDTAWRTIAKNKFDMSVSAITEYGKGLVIIVPQIISKSSFIEELLESVLPELRPDLFTEIERGKWTHLPEYELERIKELENRKNLIISEKEKEINEILKEIATQRKTNGWIHDLLTTTGDDLVTAIKNALSELGFKHIIDVDEIRDAESKSRREDLRIEDGETLLVVDIKGVKGRASDDDIMQANKHALINMRELKKTNIQGLSIINQQRNIPPLDRDNANAFRKEILDFAGETGLGLLTTFDLYRMVVNKQKHNWPTEFIKPIFYHHQRIFAIPTHYLYIGTVDKIFTDFFGTHITNNTITVGDFLAIEGDIYFSEFEVNSIQINNTTVETATVGDSAGFRWPESMGKLRENMRVYAIPKSAKQRSN
ncbi:hypothetical protein ACKUG4_24300 [Pseudomonas glycinae]|uniref:hypothetical protein n=1 Tax=Candidatus Pseudomonas auctus TaxID=3461260 RepID=UPI003B90733E